MALLHKLLGPIGEYRRQKPVSTGKRRPKRTRNRPATKKNQLGFQRPEVLDAISIGFNSTARTLEAYGRQRRSTTNGKTTSEAEIPTNKIDGWSERSPAIFVCRATLPSVLTNCLPTLVAAASQNKQDPLAIRLVPLRATAEPFLVQCLHMSRVGIVGVWPENPGAEVLLQFVQEQIQPIDLHWIHTPSPTTYLPVKITAVETKGMKSKRKRQREVSLTKGIP